MELALYGGYVMTADYIPNTERKPHAKNMTSEGVWLA